MQGCMTCSCNGVVRGSWRVEDTDEYRSVSCKELHPIIGIVEGKSLQGPILSCNVWNALLHLR